MSGGELFDYRWPDFEAADGKWADKEMDELYRDLFIGGEFAVRSYGGLAQSLDFWLSGDIGEEGYRDAVKRFKEKWFHRTPKSRVDYYRRVMDEACERCKMELGLTSFEEYERKLEGAES